MRSSEKVWKAGVSKASRPCVRIQVIKISDSRGV